ncbi:MAG TPA: type II toxin-antitoxin system ParD family antitoxin [Tepidisphaeraceae bacterium]|nr:type II toxin-antitoxin system ParD family antitoxin [Tepidisphaeraceae bacterium]
MTIGIDLPPDLKSYIDEQVTLGRYRDASECVQSLVEADKMRRLRSEIETDLLEAVRAPSTDFTEQDWEDIRTLGHREIKRRR